MKITVKKTSSFDLCPFLRAEHVQRIMKGGIPE